MANGDNDGDETDNSTTQQTEPTDRQTKTLHRINDKLATNIEKRAKTKGEAANQRPCATFPERATTLTTRHRPSAMAQWHHYYLSHFVHFTPLSSWPSNLFKVCCCYVLVCVNSF